MKRSLVRFLVAASLSCGGFAASADDGELFDDRYYVAPMGSITGNRGDANLGDGMGGALAIGKSVMPHLGVEIVGDYLRYRGKTVTTSTTGQLCGVLTQCPDQVGQLPDQRNYGGGIGVNFYTSPNNAGLYFHANAEGGDRLIYNAGLGFDQAFLHRALYVRAELLYHKESDYSAGPLFHLGVRIPLGSARQPAQAAPPPPVEVVPVEQTAPAPEPAPAPPTCQGPTPGQPISFEGCKTGDTIVLHGVNFEFNKATLTVNAKTLLDQVADALLARKDIKVEIDGHTDGKGSVPYNQKLSERRSASVTEYLASRGIDPARMTSKGFGKSMPIADNATDEGRELNRRVELKVTDSASAATPPPGALPASSPANSAPPPAPPQASEELPPAEPATAPVSVKKRSAKNHKKAAPAGGPPAEAPAQPESAVSPPEPAPAQATQDASPAPSEPAGPDQSAPPPPPTPGSAPSSEAPAPTEPAPAPPEPAPAKSD